MDLLTAQEELSLVRIAQGEDRDAARGAIAILLEAFTPRIMKASRSISRKTSADLNDVAQDLRLAFISILPGFDVASGNRLYTYVQHVERNVYYTHSIGRSHLSLKSNHRHVIAWERVRRTRSSSLTEKEYVELAGEAGLSVDLAKAIDIARLPTTRLDTIAEYGEEGASSMDAMLSDHTSEDDAHAAIDRKLLLSLLRDFGVTLTGRDQKIWHTRIMQDFNDRANLAVLAEELDISRERVRQLEEKIKSKAERYVKQRLVAPYPDDVEHHGESFRKAPCLTEHS